MRKRCWLDPGLILFTKGQPEENPGACRWLVDDGGLDPAIKAGLKAVLILHAHT